MPKLRLRLNPKPDLGNASVGMLSLRFQKLEVLFIKTKKIATVAICVSLAIVLDYIKEFIPFLNMPTGGSINIALIPCVVISFLYDEKIGLLTGFLWWLVSSALGLNPYYVSLAQYICDYIFPSVIIGAASFLYVRKNKTINIYLGITLVMFLRTMALVLSGAVFWVSEDAAFSLSAWTFSLSYNLPYCVLTTIMLLIVVPPLVKRLSKNVIR